MTVVQGAMQQYRIQETCPARLLSLLKPLSIGKAVGNIETEDEGVK